MAVDALTATGASHSAGVATLTNLVVGHSETSRFYGYRVRVTPAGVTVSAGASTLSFPISLDRARDLALALLRAVT